MLRWVGCGWVVLGWLRVMEGLCNREGCPDGLKVYLFSLSGSVLVLSLVKIDRRSGQLTGVGLGRSMQLLRSPKNREFPST